jgi:hypothetical protein
VTSFEHLAPPISQTRYVNVFPFPVGESVWNPSLAVTIRVVWR